VAELPVDVVLPDVVAAVETTGVCILQAPPGAGKTSCVPLALLPVVTGKILMLEPRRLAARAAADRLAAQLGEVPGDTVGYRIRGDSVAGARIEVVTEGILTRMLQSDPSLPGVDAVIFDEFHERSLNADLGLALTWEARQALRPDLKLIVMSATLDAGPVADMLDNAPIITSDGRSFPVETRWLPQPLPKLKTHGAWEGQVADLVLRAVSETEGGVLVFLPGAGEIRRVASRLASALPNACKLRPLYGALTFQEQRDAMRPEKDGRKIVLATSIAETSLTIEDIRVVVDAGRARRAQFDPRSGMSRLMTTTVSKAEAIQRAGRAGRVAPGVAYRMWAKAAEGAMPGFPPAEIEAADLSGLALELAIWGSTPDELAFLTPPPTQALREAQALLTTLGALDGQARITPHGRALARLPLHPRLAHMLIRAGAAAAPVAALLSNRLPVHSRESDLALHVRALQDNRGGEFKQIKQDAMRFAKLVPDEPQLSLGETVALAYPDRVAQRRKGDAARYVMSGGKGAFLDDSDRLANHPFIVACDLDGDTREARIRLAAHLDKDAMRSLFEDQIFWQGNCTWSRREGRVIARQEERFGVLILQERNWAEAADADIVKAMMEGIRQIGLRLSPAANRLRARVALVEGLPDMSDEALLANLEIWLAPYIEGLRSKEDWKRFDALNALRAMLVWDQAQLLDRVAPAHFTTPLGRKIPIDYSGEAPEIQLKLQEMFGQTTHPMIGKIPLRVTLLSPGQKPVQTTQDIPGFWASSYGDVRRDMRGRYPRHPWPEDPTQADPTLRANPRGT